MSTSGHVDVSQDDDGPLPSIFKNEVHNEPAAPRERSRSPVPEWAAGALVLQSQWLSILLLVTRRLSTCDTTDDLPQQIREHFTHIKAGEIPVESHAQASIAMRNRTKVVAVEEVRRFQTAIPLKRKDQTF